MFPAAREAGIRLFDVRDPQQGIVHVIFPELGIVLPGATLVGPDRHTCTQGAMGAMAWGIGSAEAEHVLATGTLRVTRPRTMRVRFEGSLKPGVTAKDLALCLISLHGSAEGNVYAVEFAGSAVHELEIEARLTLCNMATEFPAVTGQAAKPMAVRISTWAIYDVFETSDSGSVFVGIVSDGLWRKFKLCDAFELAALGADPRYRTNEGRVANRDVLLPQVRALFKELTKSELIAKLERTGLPFAPIGRPEDMFDDPHLAACGGLAQTTLPDGRITRLPKWPIEMDGRRPSSGGSLSKAGEDGVLVLQSLGLTAGEIAGLLERGTLGQAQC